MVCWLEVEDMVGPMLAVVWVEGEREESEGLLRGWWRGMWFVWPEYWDWVSTGMGPETEGRE